MVQRLDSNPRPPAPKADAIQTKLSRALIGLQIRVCNGYINIIFLKQNIYDGYSKEQSLMRPTVPDQVVRGRMGHKLICDLI